MVGSFNHKGTGSNLQNSSCTPEGLSAMIPGEPEVKIFSLAAAMMSASRTSFRRLRSKILGRPAKPKLPDISGVFCACTSLKILDVAPAMPAFFASPKRKIHSYLSRHLNMGRPLWLRKDYLRWSLGSPRSKSSLSPPPWCPLPGPPFGAFVRRFSSDSGRIRTFNLLIRSQVLYPVELRGQAL